MSSLHSAFRLVILLLICAVLSIWFLADRCLCRQKRTRTRKLNLTPSAYEGLNEPLIFVGGIPKSGTTLMRVMLESHPDVHCGQETYVITEVLDRRVAWLNEKADDAALLDHAVASFIHELVARHGSHRRTRRLCNKDPYAHRHISFLARVFPASKFILMIRDGRAQAYSRWLLDRRDSRLVDAAYRDYLREWNDLMTVMDLQCRQVGRKRCFYMYYEKLILNPVKEMRSLLKFLDLPWDDAVLHHEEHVGNRSTVAKMGRISKDAQPVDTKALIDWVIKAQANADRNAIGALRLQAAIYEQHEKIVKPVNTGSLAKWFGKLPADIVRDLREIAPMLLRLGYDPNVTKTTPSYKTLDGAALHDIT